MRVLQNIVLMSWSVVAITLLWSMAVGIAQQQPDPAKLAPLYRQQRDIANDSIAVCSAAVIDLQAKIAELEKRLAEVAAEKPRE